MDPLYAGAAPGMGLWTGPPAPLPAEPQPTTPLVPGAPLIAYTLPPSPDALDARAQMGLLYAEVPQDPLSVMPPDPWQQPPDLWSLPAHRNRPEDVDPEQAAFYEAQKYAWKQSGVLQAPAGGAPMRQDGYDIIPNVGRPPERIAAGTAAGAFEELQQGDPNDTFARWVGAVADNGINPLDGDPPAPMSDAALEAAAGLPPDASMADINRAYMVGLLDSNPQGQLRDSARRDIKQAYDLLPYLTDADRLGIEYPGVATEQASAMELQRVVTGNVMTDGLGPSDEGAIGEAWYQQLHAPDAASQVNMPKLAADAQQRRADLVTMPSPYESPETLPAPVPRCQPVEVKSGQGGLVGDDVAQFNDYLGLVKASRDAYVAGVPADGDPTVFDAGAGPARALDFRLVNTDPRAAAENAERVAPSVLAGDLQYQTFNDRGETRTWSQADLYGPDDGFVMDEGWQDEAFLQATPEAVARQIIEFAAPADHGPEDATVMDAG